MKYHKKVLKNGLRIITVSMPSSLTTTVLVLTETGSKYETKRINGISHFLEHMCFKGTEKRSTARMISEELDGLGAKYNAFTSHEYTGYYAKAEARHFGKVLDILSDIYLHSTFPAKEIEKERGVIIGEIQMYEDTPQRQVWDLLTNLLYGDQPAGWEVAGTRETARSLVRKDFTQYKESHYVASGTVVVVAGNVQKREVVLKVKNAFTLIPTSKKIGKKKVKEAQREPHVILKHKETSQTHIILGFRSYNTYQKEHLISQVLASVLGGGMSSRLFHKVREELGAGYYVGADTEGYTDHGFLACFAGVDNNRVFEIIHVILHELKTIRDEEVSHTELTKVKNYLIGNLFSSLETSHTLATFYGNHEVLRKPLKTPKEIADEVRRVTPEEVQKIAREIFSNEGLNLAMIGPSKDKERFRSILSL